jgi:hypothetical protein
MLETDPANLQPKVRPLNRRVADFIRANQPPDIAAARINAALDVVESPWPRREEAMLREWLEDDTRAGTDHRNRPGTVSRAGPFTADSVRGDRTRVLACLIARSRALHPGERIVIGRGAPAIVPKQVKRLAPRQRERSATPGRLTWGLITTAREKDRRRSGAMQFGLFWHSGLWRFRARWPFYPISQRLQRTGRRRTRQSPPAARHAAAPLKPLRPGDPGRHVSLRDRVRGYLGDT